MRPGDTELRGLKIPGAILLVVAACVACGGGQGGPDPVQRPTPALPVQPAPLSANAQAMLEDVARLRGLAPPEGFKAGYVTRAQLPAVLANAITAEDRSWFARTTTLYRLLGYIGPGDDFFAIYQAFANEAVSGLYEPSRRTAWVVVMDAMGGFEALTPGERATLAHEFLHAVQDGRFGLESAAKRARDDHDQDIGLAALVEGDAVTHERLFSGRGGMVPGLHLLFADVGGSPPGIPAAIERAFRFPYGAGADWVGALRERGGTAAIDRLFEAGPPATATILHGAGDGAPAPQPGLPGLDRVLGAGWRRESGGALGEFEWQNFLLQRVRALDAATAAAGWTADRYEVLVRGGSSLLVARVSCRDDDAASTLRHALRGWADAAGLVTAQRSRYTLAEAKGSNTMAVDAGGGREVVLVIGTGRNDVEAAIAALTGG